MLRVTERTHLHLGGQKEARRSHEEALVALERVKHEELVEEDQRRRYRIDRPALPPPKPGNVRHTWTETSQGVDNQSG